MDLTKTQNFLEDKVLLVVDDDLPNRTLVVDIVLDLLPSMTVLTAKDGEQALYVLGKKKVAVILLDWEMPVLNGIETLQKLQQHETWAKIPVIMYTGAMTATHNLQKAFHFGAIDFLRKPADPLELVTRIRSVVYQKVLEENRSIAEKVLLETEQRYLKQEMELLRKELSSYLLLLAHKNKVLIDLKARCLEKETDSEKLLQQVARQIGRLITTDDYWGDFMEKFNKTDPKFVKLLLEQWPSLSKGEVRICTLIRFGMQSKDIMNLLNISSEGIKKSRYRIRKKMNLQTEENLEKKLLGV